MPRPSRVLAMSGGLAAAVVLISSTAAYAASRAQPTDETYVACVNNTTGAMRMIDPLTGQTCADDPGPGQERQISWSKSDARGPEGPAGPRGPRGESGDDGEDGDGGGRLGRLEDLEGIPCSSGTDAGRVEITIGAPENGSMIQLICMTEGTVSTTRTPPSPVPTPEPTRTTEPRPAPQTTNPPESDWDEHPADDAGGGGSPTAGDGPGGGGNDGGGDSPAAGSPGDGGGNGDPAEGSAAPPA